MTWPAYTSACRADVDALLRKGGSLSAYRANPQVGVEPAKGSWAWRLERDIERRFRVRHAVAVNSGTAALHAGLVSCDLRGGEVVTSPYTFSATVAAILLAGGVPRFADVDPHTYCITPETVRKHVTKKTKAILPVSIFGGMCDVQGLKAFGVPVVEDACQAVGARNAAGYSGTHGLAGVYSMNGGKNVPAGECGAVVTNDSEIAARARLLMNHGESFYKKDIGYNYRPNELTACVAYHGLQSVQERNKRRRDIVGAFEKALDVKYIIPVGERKKESHVYYVYPIRLRENVDRRVFLAACASRGLNITGGYITPSLEKYPAFRRFCGAPLPVVTWLSEISLCLINSFTPDQPVSHGVEVAEKLSEVIREVV